MSGRAYPGFPETVRGAWGGRIWLGDLFVGVSLASADDFDAAAVIPAFAGDVSAGMRRSRGFFFSPAQLTLQQVLKHFFQFFLLCLVHSFFSWEPQSRAGPVTGGAEHFPIVVSKRGVCTLVRPFGGNL